MKPGRIVGLILGLVVFALPAIALLVGGAVATGGYLIERSDDGFFDETLDRLSSATAAIATEDVDLREDPGPPEWILERLDATVRLQARAVEDGASLFVGIASAADVAAYLDGVAYDEIYDISSSGRVDYRTVPGTAAVAAPTDQTFWAAANHGPGEVELQWDLESGEWIALVMNADGSSGVLADVTVGIRSNAILAAGIAMLVVGMFLAALAVAVILVAVRGGAPREDEVAAMEPALAPPRPAGAEPVRLTATLDDELSPWMWLVKWFLAIPHLIVLAFLWLAFIVVTFFAGVSILFTGRYPRGMFDFNVGVLRWWWRVSYYAFQGGLGTDRYPPFSLQQEDYPATLEVEYPDQLSQGLVLVKWWLLAIPHYLVVALLVAAPAWPSWGSRVSDWQSDQGVWMGGLTGVLVLIAAVILLFTARYPRPLFDLIVGLNRWVFRVAAYAALMTDRYPPFRLDQGGEEPDGLAATGSHEKPPPNVSSSAPM